MADERWLDVHLADGRKLEAVVGGPEEGLPLLLHNGTPGAALLFPPHSQEAARRGLRLVTYSRPGYGTSTACRGRSVGDAAADAAALLDAIDAPRFLTVGISGGGPHALACAALLGDRCVAAASVAGVAPYNAVGLDYLAEMADENIAEFAAALGPEDEFVSFLETQAAGMAGIASKDMAAALGGLVSDVDKAALTRERAEYLADSFRRSVASGIWGWADDDLAFVKPWGFDPASIARPVAIWQGGQDRFVPFSHGVWLAGHIPSARPHLLPGEGHLSLGFGAFESVIDDLLEQAA